MSNRPTSIPDHFDEVFTVREAKRSGVTAWRLNREDLVAPFRGVRARKADVLTDLDAEQKLLQQMRHLRPLLSERAFFSFGAAAVALGLPLPRAALSTLDVSTFGSSHPTRLSGVAGHRTTPGMVTVIEHDGFRITDAASTWAQLGSRLSLRDLVAVGDAAVRAKKPAGPYAPQKTTPPLATLDELSDAAKRKHPKRHMLLKALPLIRTNSWSRPESHVRLLLMEAGLPEPELNYNVFDEIGHWVKCVDLAYPQWRVAIEYQSAYHREAKQYAKDIAAQSELLRLGWYTVQLASDQVFAHPRMTAETVSEAIAAQKARPLFYHAKPVLPD